jgi:hypothetical protein
VRWCCVTGDLRFNGVLPLGEDVVGIINAPPQAVDLALRGVDDDATGSRLGFSGCRTLGGWGAAQLLKACLSPAGEGTIAVIGHDRKMPVFDSHALERCTRRTQTLWSEGLRYASDKNRPGARMSQL